MRVTLINRDSKTSEETFDQFRHRLDSGQI